MGHSEVQKSPMYVSKSSRLHAPLWSDETPTMSSLASFINRLPIELLLYIFEFVLALPHFPYSFTTNGIRTLSRVSSTWYHTIASTPSFWSTICLSVKDGWTLNWIRMALERSQHASLDVRAERVACGQDGPSIDSLSLFIDHRSRFKRLCYDLGFPFLVELLVADAPNLEQFYVSLPADYQIPPRSPPNAVSLFQGNAPRLRCVSLRNIPVHWDTTILSGLQSLILTNMCIPLRPFLDTLRLSPSLRDLYVGMCRFDILEDGRVEDPIHLPELRYFTLTTLPKDPHALAPVIIQQMTAPQLRDLFIHPYNYQPSSSFDAATNGIAVEALGHRRDLIIERWSLAGVNFYRDRKTSPNPSGEFFLRFEEEGQAWRFLHAVDQAQLQSIIDLQIRVDLLPNNPQINLGVLLKFTNIISLTFAIDHSSLILDLLGEKEYTRLLFPSLKRLSIKFLNDMTSELFNGLEKVVELRGRREETEEALSDGYGALPSALREVRVLVDGLPLPSNDSKECATRTVEDGSKLKRRLDEWDYFVSSLY